jgi:hypothetical protein
MGKAKKGTDTNRSMMERLVTKLLGASACAARMRTKKNMTLAKNTTTESAASDQASRAAARGFIPRTPFIPEPSILFVCPFCHDPTLQDYRLPSVTAPVTRKEYVVNFLEPLQTPFGEPLFPALLG